MKSSECFYRIAQDRLFWRADISYLRNHFLEIPLNKVEQNYFFAIPETNKRFSSTEPRGI